MAVGAFTWISPTTSLYLLGVDQLSPTHTSSLTLRLFGVRDVLLGAGLYYAISLPRNDPTWNILVTMGLVADSFDVVASILATFEGLPVYPRISVGVGAFVFACMENKNYMK